jgi:hypothetical protein
MLWNREREGLVLAKIEMETKWFESPTGQHALKRLVEVWWGAFVTYMTATMVPQAACTFRAALRTAALSGAVYPYCVPLLCTPAACLCSP